MGLILNNQEKYNEALKYFQNWREITFNGS
jgi:hypothetical protein